MMERVVGHLDLDYFYAQVEEVENPSIKGRPVLVCVFSGRTEESGVVSTANYRARELGVGSGMPIVVAKKKLQKAEPVIIKMEHEKYEMISERIMRRVEERVDILEQTGIDEAFFDLTASTGGDYDDARKKAEGLKDAILASEHLTCSIGIGRSKAVAKLASDSAKPGGLLIVRPDATGTFLDETPVNKLYGVGPKTAGALKEIDVETIGQLSHANEDDLASRFGKKFSAYLLAASRGLDDALVLAGLEPAQFSRMVTLKRDTRSPEEALEQLSQGILDVQQRLSLSGKSFRTLSAIGILTDLSSHTKSKTFETPVADISAIRDSALDLFTGLSASVQKDFRRVGIRVSGLTKTENQLHLSEFTPSAAGP